MFAESMFVFFFLLLGNYIAFSNAAGMKFYSDIKRRIAIKFNNFPDEYINKQKKS